MDLKELLAQPARKYIVRSILSHEDASSRKTIEEDTGLHEQNLFWHLRQLCENNVLAWTYDPRPGLMKQRLYFIDPDGPDNLQDVLRELFPDKMESFPINQSVPSIYTLSASLLLLAKWYEGDVGAIEPLDKVRAYLQTFSIGQQVLQEDEENTLSPDL